MKKSKFYVCRQLGVSEATFSVWKKKYSRRRKLPER